MPLPSTASRYSGESCLMVCRRDRSHERIKELRKVFHSIEYDDDMTFPRLAQVLRCYCTSGVKPETEPG